MKKNNYQTTDLTCLKKNVDLKNEEDPRLERELAWNEWHPQSNL